MKYCPECGAERLPNARFCQQCGFAYPGATRPVFALGISVVIFLSGLAYAIVQRGIIPNIEPDTLPPVMAEDDHSDHDDHDHEHEEEANPAQGGQQHASGDVGRFAQLRDFFAAHGIIGPKIFSFKVENDNFAVLYLDQFPMSAMPEGPRGQLDRTIKEQMAYLGEGVKLEIRDARNRAVMATYEF